MRKFIYCFLTACLVVGSCCVNSSYADDQSNTGTGAVAGGLLGAIAGGVIGNQNHHKTAQGAVIGGLLGAVTGALVGSKVKKSPDTQNTANAQNVQSVEDKTAPQQATSPSEQQVAQPSQAAQPVQPEQAQVAARQQPAQQQVVDKDRTESAEIKSFWDKEQPRLDEQIKQGKILKIKELYLGMNIDEAAKIFNEKLGTNLKVVAGSQAQDILSAMGIYTTESPGGHVAYDSNNMQWLFIFVAMENKQVSGINIPADLVDKLFNTSGLPADDFAKKFIDNYKIPSMDPFIEAGASGNPLSGWRYVSKDGFQVTIFSNKGILIKKMAAASEMKFN